MAGAPKLPPEKQSEAPVLSPEDRDRYLHPTNLAAAGMFVQGEIWRDLKRVLLARCPPSADVTDEIHVAAAKGFKATAWVELIALIERLPFDQPPGPTPSPIPEPLLHTED